MSSAADTTTRTFETPKMVSAVDGLYERSPPGRDHWNDWRFPNLEWRSEFGFRLSLHGLGRCGR